MAIVFTQIEIAARAGELWTILADFEAYPGWNPAFMIASQGDNQKLIIRLHPRGQPSLLFRGRMAGFEQPKIMMFEASWIDTRVLNWHHQIEIEQKPTHCILRQTARFTGSLNKIIPNFMMLPVKHGLARMNEALRARLEDEATFLRAHQLEREQS